MKKTLNIDAKLLAEARAACGASSDTETIHRGLRELARQAAMRRLVALTGTEPDAVDVPRRREAPLPVPKAKAGR